jgi:hypothetical protein
MGLLIFWVPYTNDQKGVFLALMNPTTKKQVATTDIKTSASTLPQ